MVQGDYGPFHPNFPVKVPLWLAVMLHKRKKCRIEPPDWLQSEHLAGLQPAHSRLAAPCSEPTLCQIPSSAVLSVAQLWVSEYANDGDGLYNIM